MSVAVCRSSAAPFHLEKEVIGSILMPAARARESPLISPTASMPTNSWLAPAQQQETGNTSVENNNKVEERPGQIDIWSMIQSQKTNAPATADPPAPYVHPHMRRSSSLMSQRSLEMCTESLGSETGSNDFSSLFSDDDREWFSSSSEVEEEEEEEIQEETVQQERGARYGGERVAGNGRKELTSVNYHCSISWRSPPRSFPPPLPSISRRDGPCIHMRPHRRDGRLVVEAVPVPSQNYLHARRQDGRLLLSFIDTSFHQPCTKEDTTEMPPQPQDLKQEEHVEEAATAAREQAEEVESDENDRFEEEEEDVEEVEEEEEEEEEVEVVDRGTVVEVKVSTQPQQQSGAMKVHRSSLVINKFVGGAPLSNQNRWAAPAPHLPKQEDNYNDNPSAAPPPQRRLAPTPTTAAAAAVAASSHSASPEAVGQRPPSPDNKLLFTSKRRNREELLHHMRRCSELRRPLFYFEPYCIATSS